MLNILLSGCCGRMGKAISEIVENRDDMEITAGLDVRDDKSTGYPVFTDIGDCPLEVDAVIDFSHPSAFDGIVSFCSSNNIPLVMATTGLSHEQIERLGEASKSTAVFRSSNMSVGVNILMELARKAASSAKGMFDVEIIEKHHRNKLDAPSGTALSIADAINEGLDSPLEPVYDRTSRRQTRPDSEMGISVIRGGSIVGEHTVVFAGSDEIIEIRHEALSRRIFAEGAIRAAIFMAGRKTGLYSMSDMLND